jgi:hypothetical protein
MKSIDAVEVIKYHGGDTDVVIKHLITLSPLHAEILKKVEANNGWIEYREFRYDSEHKENNEIIKCFELVENGILKTDGMSWHLTFHLTDIGKRIACQL